MGGMNRKPPDADALHEAALNHLARYAATQASLARVLARRVDRWARFAAGSEAADPQALAAAARAAKEAIPSVIARLREAGVLDDAAFAAARARRLARGGKSRRLTLAHLAAKGVGMGIAAEIVEESPERELAAACAYLRRRRAGPFGDAPELKTLAAMARAGFSQDIAMRALRMGQDEAETWIKTLQA